MQSVGEQLRRARLEKNLTLDEVYKQTKIHARVLEALEQDRAHNFLSPLYIKGFLKNYAQYLGLDSQRLLKEYIDSQKKGTEAVQIISKKKQKVFPQVNPFLILRIALVIIFSFAFIFYFRFVLRRLSGPAQPARMQKVKVEVIPAPRVLAEELVLEVKTLDNCWLRVMVDNQSIFQDTLPKGRRERWQAKERIELRIGKPEALEVFLGGKRIDLKKAKVKKGLIITHEGIEGK